LRTGAARDLGIARQFHHLNVPRIGEAVRDHSRARCGCIFKPAPLRCRGSAVIRKCAPPIANCGGRGPARLPGFRGRA